MKILRDLTDWLAIAGFIALAFLIVCIHRGLFGTWPNWDE